MWVKFYLNVWNWLNSLNWGGKSSRALPTLIRETPLRLFFVVVVVLSAIIKATPLPDCTGIKVQTTLSLSMVNIKTNTASDKELSTRAQTNEPRLRAWTDVSRNFLPLSGPPLSFLRPHVGTFAKNPLHSRWSSPCIPSERGQARAHTSRSKPIQKAPRHARSLLSTLAPLPQQRRSDGLIPLTWATNVRSDIAATSGEVRCFVPVLPDSLLQPRLRWGDLPPQEPQVTLLWQVPNVHLHESGQRGHERGLSGGNIRFLFAAITFKLTRCARKRRLRGSHVTQLPLDWTTKVRKVDLKVKGSRSVQDAASVLKVKAPVL